jgi:carboxyl-terminal processing protease
VTTVPGMARRTWHIARRGWQVARSTWHITCRTPHVAHEHVARGTRPAAPVTVTLLLLSAAALTAQLPQGLETFDAAWTTVRDKHFDEKLNGVDWEAVRRELRPRAEAATTTGELRAVIRDMLGRLGQSHFALIPATAEPAAGVAADLSGDPGFDVRLVGRDLLVTDVEPTGPAAAAGLKPGWRLTAIGTAQVTLASQRRAETGRPVTVGNLPTMFVRVENERRQTPRGGTAGIIRFNVWMTAVDGPFQRAMDEYRSADGIIIDLRGNPGGLAAMMMGIAGHFMTDRQPLGVMKTRDNEPLRFVANPRLVSAAGLPVQPFAGPVAILVDAMSGSASECFTGGMQSLKRARVFGQTSMGQALPALFQRLPNGDLMIHAYGDFVTSDGTRLEGRGVVPDEILPLRREDLLAGRDRTLDAALAWIDQARAAGKPQHP